MGHHAPPVHLSAARATRDESLADMVAALCEYGEDRFHLQDLLVFWGSSPLTQGPLIYAYPDEPVRWIIPAHAGSTCGHQL